MGTCTICLEALKSPVSLPCGHVFCHECIIRIVHSSNSQTVDHHCPVCRSRYSIVNIDPALVPEFLRPHVLPSLRRVYIESTSCPTSPPPAAPTDYANVKAENNCLRQHCVAWQRRAEVHAAATLGLASLARTARDHALRMKAERDELEKKYQALKRKYQELESGTPTSSMLLSTSSSNDDRSTRSPESSTPLSTSPSSSLQYPSNLHFSESARPAAKRRRVDSPLPNYDSAPFTTSTPRRHHHGSSTLGC